MGHHLKDEGWDFQICTRILPVNLLLKWVAEPPCKMATLRISLINSILGEVCEIFDVNIPWGTGCKWHFLNICEPLTGKTLGSCPLCERQDRLKSHYPNEIKMVRIAWFKSIAAIIMNFEMYFYFSLVICNFVVLIPGRLRDLKRD